MLSARSKQFLHLLPRLLRGRAEPNRFVPRLEEPSPSSQQEAPRSHFPNHRSDRSSPQGYESPWSEWEGQGTSIIITSEAAAAQLPVCRSFGLWLRGRGREPYFSGPEQLLQFFRRKTRKGGLRGSCVFGDRKEKG